MNNSPSSSTELRYTKHAKDRMSDPTPSNIKKQLIESSSRAVGGSIGYNSRTRNFKNIVKNDVQPRGISYKVIEDTISTGQQIAASEGGLKFVKGDNVIITSDKKDLIITAYNSKRSKSQVNLKKVVNAAVEKYSHIADAADDSIGSPLLWNKAIKSAKNDVEKKKDIAREKQRARKRR